MKRNLLLAFALLVAEKADAQQASYPKGIDHVIVIGVDALSPNGIRKANTPVIHKMISGGAIKWNVRTVLPSTSSPNWASMIMGAGTEAHGVLDNDWEGNGPALPPNVRGKSGLFPTIFSVVRKAKPKAEIGAVYQWDGFGRLFEKEAVSYDRTNGSLDSTIIIFNKYITQKKPTFAFVHIDDVDGAGHGDGHGTPAYYKMIGKVDSLIGTILNTVNKAGIAQNTLVILTADHGGIGFGHGGATPEEAEIAMVFYGAGVKQGYQVKQQVYTYDLAASIAFALKIVPPYAWTGRPVKSAFAGFSEPANLWLGEETIAAPVIYPDKYLYSKAGGLYVDKTATVKIEAVDGAEIRYTIDGTMPKKQSTLYKAAFELDRSAVVQARAFSKTGAASLITPAYFRIVKSNNGHGLNIRFYIGDNWHHIPAVDELKPVKTWTNYEFNLNRDTVVKILGPNKDCFAISMDGYIEITVAGEYTFYTQSDDGSQLYIDGKKVVDNNDSHGVIERSGSRQLDKGRHAIKVNFFNEAGGYWLDALYKGPGIPKQLIPASVLYLKK